MNDRGAAGAGGRPDSMGGGGFLGHPRALSTLFFTEMWERFSFYGMKAMLFLYITAQIVEGPQSGLGIGAEEGGAIAGLYNSLVYIFALPGGWLADRILGQRRAVLYGGIIIALGHFSMAVPSLPTFYLGLALIVLGTGLLKPNVSTMVGDLYEGASPVRRDGGFSVFYMGINIGAFSAPLLCGQVRESFGWHAGFGLAGIGMTFGILWYLFDQKSLGTLGLSPKSEPAERDAAKSIALRGLMGAAALVGLISLCHITGVFAVTWILVSNVAGVAALAVVALFLGYLIVFGGLTATQKRQVVMVGVLFLLMALFWSGFEQASTSLNVFARDITDRVLFGWTAPTEFLQAINPIFIIALSPVFSALWIRMGAKNLNPSVPVKFALGLLQLGLGFFVIMFAADLAGGSAVKVDGGDVSKVSPAWLCLTYLFFTTGELCISPVGLSTVSRLAPQRFVSQMMGIWFIASALGNLIAGRVGGMIETLPHSRIFLIVGLITAGAGAAFLLIAPLCQKKLMGDVR